MKKALAGLIIAMLFFALGRNQPAVVKTAFHDEAGYSKVTRVQNKNNSTEQKATQLPTPEETQGESPASTLTWDQKIATLVDSELFEELYSEKFKSQWQTALPALKNRLFSTLPKSTEPEFLEKEITARLGILKALGKLEVENNEELKQFLFAYIEFAGKRSSSHPWLLQREAAHTLTSNNDLDENEQQTISHNLDPRARNTAALPDIEIVDRTLAGEQ